MDAILWSATQEQRRQTALWRFAEATAAQHGAAPDDYPALHSWSLKEPDAFYSALWDFVDIVGDKGTRSVVAGERLQDTRFFPDARLNYAENLLRNPDASLALVVRYENSTRRSISRAQLHALVSRLVQALQAEGVGTGDRVAAIVTHDVEALAAYLATAALGAIWSSCSPDFGPVAASDRLCQIAPKVLLALTQYDYNGKQHDVVPSITAVAQGTALTRIVLVADAVPTALATLPCVILNDWLAPFTPGTIPYARLPFATPLAILYSSGTTGKPKCIVHSAGGLLLQHKKELLLHCDLRPGEHFFYFTTCGWMMWNWQVSGLACGATLVSADGNPMYPSPARLPALCETEKLHIFGTSARYLAACASAELKPGASLRLSSLRLVLSTGSPLLPQGFDHVYQDWKQDVQLASISGGTDICGCFLGGNPLLPVRRGELQCALLGMDMAVFDDDGNEIIGQAGELVCRSAHPSMPLGFLGDEDGQRYHAAYFARFPGAWTQGDYAEHCASGGFIIQGRSDATLNPGGVRIGTAEIYRQLQDFADIEEALAVGQDIDGDQQVVLFIKLREGSVLDTVLQQAIRSSIRKGASPRHVPARIHAVSDFPRTRSGKLCESAVREVINGREVKQLDALANPQALEQFQTQDQRAQ
jgi:acetoacetyl-CoA synthetase